MFSVVDESIIKAIEFVQYYGWYVVFTLIALYFAEPWISSARHRMSLASANAPSRVRILEQERQRVRLRQQLNHTLKKNEDNGNNAGH